MSRFTSVVLGATALVALSATPSLAQSVFDGPYTGAYVGYTDGDVKTGAGTSVQDNGIDGFSFGGYTGYGRTFGQIFLGAEAELGFNEVDGDRTVGGIITEAEAGWTYGLAARAGFLATPDALVYGRVGWQRAEFDLTGTAQVTAPPTGGAIGGTDKWLDGWRVGGGVDWSLGNNLIARAEYTYTDYEKNLFLVGNAPVAYEPTESLFRVGLAYRY